MILRVVRGRAWKRTTASEILSSVRFNMHTTEQRTADNPCPTFHNDKPAPIVLPDLENTAGRSARCASPGTSRHSQFDATYDSSIEVNATSLHSVVHALTITNLGISQNGTAPDGHDEKRVVSEQSSLHTLCTPVSRADSCDSPRVELQDPAHMTTSV